MHPHYQFVITCALVALSLGIVCVLMAEKFRSKTKGSYARVVRAMGGVFIFASFGILIVGLRQPIA